jgi:NTE family protein
VPWRLPPTRCRRAASRPQPYTRRLRCRRRALTATEPLTATELLTATERMDETPRNRQRKIPVELALQGGGAHGAFTWGVLDRLLEDPCIEFSGISGTSAGAINAVVLASGLAAGGRDGARSALRDFWTRVADSGRGGALGMDFLKAFLGNWSFGISPMQIYLDMVGRMVSPYQFNPFNLNPLRDILAQSVDFERIRRNDSPRVYVAATNVRTGRTRLFTDDSLSADAVMASACLPMLFHAVEIDGEPYWDGGYTANPAVLPLIERCASADLVIVQINPVDRPALPTRASDIGDRINEISFNSSLLREMQSIALLKKLIRDEVQPEHLYRDTLFAQVDRLRTHRIHGDAALAELGASSKLDTGGTFLAQLFEIGRGAADAWLAYHRKDLGRRSSLDLAEYL